MLLGIVIYVVTNHGTVEITVDDPNVVVRIDGTTIRIEKLGEPITLTFRPGTREMKATRGNMVVETKQFSLTRGHETLRVKHIPPEVASTPGPVAPTGSSPQPTRSPSTLPSSVGQATSPSGPAEPRSKGFAESIGIKLRPIPAGEFEMGSSAEDKSAFEDERPKHRVLITRPFYLSAHEVTQGQYRAVTGENPSYFQGSDELPVEQVSWNDAIVFCNKLSEQEGLKPYYRSSAGEPLGGNGFRLPTEAEWEYACRAGSSTRYSFGDEMALMDEYAWVSGNAGNKTHPVGQKDTPRRTPPRRGVETYQPEAPARDPSIPVGPRPTPSPARRARSFGTPQARGGKG
jgi:formylglycine-generating enzyme required for sulfatase activity